MQNKTPRQIFKSSPTRGVLVHMHTYIGRTYVYMHTRDPWNRGLSGDELKPPLVYRRCRWTLYRASTGKS